MDNFLSFPLEKQYHSRTLAYFTSVFEMGTGGTRPLWSSIEESDERGYL